MKVILLASAMVINIIAVAQIRLAKLELAPQQKYVVEFSDILVVDTLIMSKSSSIIFLAEAPNNFIHCKKIIIDDSCSIIGAGENGNRGKDGKKGRDGSRPCEDGLKGKSGTGGSHGSNGRNLSIYSSSIERKGIFTIDLRGGDGGNGGNGGQGGGGGEGTTVCAGGDGGDGGDGSTGGNGGNGGVLSLHCDSCPEWRVHLNDTFFFKSAGGKGGRGGTAGPAGLAGLSSPVNNVGEGKRGKKGKPGLDGKPGERGAIKFEDFN
jgi:hypothetical protein